jgi:hypothetical protein
MSADEDDVSQNLNKEKVKPEDESDRKEPNEVANGKHKKGTSKWSKSNDGAAKSRERKRPRTGEYDEQDGKGLTKVGEDENSALLDYTIPRENGSGGDLDDSDSSESDGRSSSEPRKRKLPSGTSLFAGNAVDSGSTGLVNNLNLGLAPDLGTGVNSLSAAALFSSLSALARLSGNSGSSSSQSTPSSNFSNANLFATLLGSGVVPNPFQTGDLNPSGRSGGIIAGGSSASGSTLSRSAPGDSAVLPGASGGSAALVVHSQRSAGSVGVDSSRRSSPVLWGATFAVPPTLPSKVSTDLINCLRPEFAFNRWKSQRNISGFSVENITQFHGNLLEGEYQSEPWKAAMTEFFVKNAAPWPDFKDPNFKGMCILLGKAWCEAQRSDDLA